MTCRKYLSVIVEITQNTLKKRTEQHFHDVSQKLQHNKTLDTFAAHFDQHFDQNPTPKQCHEIMILETLSTANPIGLMKTWNKSSCTLCMKERLEIMSRSRRRYRKLINSCSEVYGACGHKPKLHRFTWKWWSSQCEIVLSFSTYLI